MDGCQIEARVIVQQCYCATSIRYCATSRCPRGVGAHEVPTWGSWRVWQAKEAALYVCVWEGGEGGSTPSTLLGMIITS